MGKIIEDETPRKFPHGMTRAYHALTKDWISNEIFRRVEPQGRTMGEYFHQEIKEKYNLQINIVNSPEDNAITQNVQWASKWLNMKLMMKKDSNAAYHLPTMISKRKELGKKEKEKRSLLTEEQIKVD